MRMHKVLGYSCKVKKNNSSIKTIIKYYLK
nr:MAG TPA: hypothetical protein [Bacteriophage sp.]